MLQFGTFLLLQAAGVSATTWSSHPSLPVTEGLSYSVIFNTGLAFVAFALLSVMWSTKIAIIPRPTTSAVVRVFREIKSMPVRESCAAICFSGCDRFFTAPLGILFRPDIDVGGSHSIEKRRRITRKKGNMHQDTLADGSGGGGGGGVGSSDCKSCGEDKFPASISTSTSGVNSRAAMQRAVFSSRSTEDPTPRVDNNCLDDPNNDEDDDGVFFGRGRQDAATAADAAARRSVRYGYNLDEAEECVAIIVRQDVADILRVVSITLLSGLSYGVFSRNLAYKAVYPNTVLI